MAVNIDQGQIISMTLRYTVSGQENLLTHHYYVQRTGGFGAVSLSDAIDDMITAYNAVGGLFNTIPGIWPTTVKADWMQVQIIYPDRYAFVRRTAGMPEGSEAAQPSPPNVAAVITMKTDKAGRDQVSNKHLGAVPLGFYVAGVFTEDALNVYDNVAASLTNNVPVSNGADTFDLIPVIYHRGGLTTSDTITQRQVNNTVRVMRRRTVGLGT